MIQDAPPVAGLTIRDRQAPAWPERATARLQRFCASNAPACSAFAAGNAGRGRPDRPSTLRRQHGFYTHIPVKGKADIRFISDQSIEKSLLRALA